MTVMTSREFNQRTHAAKLAAESGPVIITDRGRPSHVLLTYRDYRTRTGGVSLAQAVAGFPEAGLVDLPLPVLGDQSRAAVFD
jgi:hypothetical protein